MSDLNSKFYWEFKTKAKGSDETASFIIQDLPEEKLDEAVIFMLKYFIPDEAMCECKKIVENAEAMEFVKMFAYELLSKKTSLVCFRKGSTDIVGLNVMTVMTKAENDAASKGLPEPFTDIMAVVKISESKFNPYKHFKVEKLLKSHGLCVHPNYRGFGICTEIFKARRPFLKFLGLKVSVADCTGIGSQIAADRAGFETHVVLEYEKLHEIQPGLYFDGIKHKYFKVSSFCVED